MPLVVKSITENRIICVGGWEFDRTTGMEVDEALGWGPAVSGSWIETQNEQGDGFSE